MTIYQAKVSTEWFKTILQVDGFDSLLGMYCNVHIYRVAYSAAELSAEW